MRTYPEYKDSGVEWIGEIPRHWEIKKITFITNDIGSGTTPKSGEDRYYENGDIPWLITGDLNDGLLFDTSRKITQLAIEDYPTLKLFPEHSVSIAMYGATIGKLGYLKLPSTVNQANCVFSFNQENCPKFWFYLFLGGRSHIISLSYGGGQPNISQDLLRSLRFPTPPLSEQKQISDYLDRKTQQIDDLIEKTERKIELLKEQRSSLVNRCVTKGLDPNVEMKDSGVEWIGEIPKGWNLKKIKYLLKSVGGGTPNTEVKEYWDGSIPWVSPKDMKSDDINNSEDKITEDGLENSTTNLIDPGSVLMVVRSGILKHTIPVGINTIPVTLNQDMKSLTPKNGLIDTKFFFHFVKGNQKNLLLEWSKLGVTVESLETVFVENSQLPLPPLSEQKQISDYLDRKTQQIDDLIEKTERKIELLKEYHQSLISFVVTGKIRVTEDVI